MHYRAMVFEAAVRTPGKNFTHFAPHQPATSTAQDAEDRKTCRELIGRGNAPLLDSNLTRYTRSANGCSDTSFDE